MRAANPCASIMSYSYECAYVSIPVNLYFTPTLHLAFTCIVFSAAAGVLAQLG